MDKVDDLTEIANRCRTDKGTREVSTGEGPSLHFTTVYQRYFKSMRHEPIRFLEIGIGGGPSLRMWYEYFTQASIHAIDIVNYAHLNNDRVTTHVANQTKRRTLRKVMERIGEVDIIIDDGGHMMKQQQVSFATLFPYLKSGGLYFIEDLHTSYWPHNGFKDLYGSRLDINRDRSNTTVKMIQGYIQTKILFSQFMKKKELAYLNESISDCTLFDLPESIYGPNQLALFIKR